MDQIAENPTRNLPMPNSVVPHSLFSDLDIHLFRAGRHHRLYEKLGSHPLEVDGRDGTYFAVWAPSARAVSVIGDFNGWDREEHPLAARWDSSGIWEGFIPGIGHGTIYKYVVVSGDGSPLEKGDPFARLWEVPPKTASVVWAPQHDWQDAEWMATREQYNALDTPTSVYEVHLGSWRKKKGGGESLSYRELADELVSYVKERGFTHVEMMPVMEHPYFPSWGYQITGYFAPTSRFGTPEDFAFLVDAFHQAGIGVILDWVPSHFPEDGHGLAQFDGTHLYDHADPRKGFHPDWKSRIFNYGRNEVRSFLVSNALFWLDRYHADGLRVDAVASMLYLDYSREEGEWIPNEYGGRENLEAITLLKEVNEAVYRDFPTAMTVAEESTAWPGVSRPVYAGGLGFGQKWMMGWMHDTLRYFGYDPVYRQYHHSEITFSLVYAFTENFQLPLSHDEVVHGKGSLLSRMPGDDWQAFANLRLLFGYMYTHPGTKLLFMGGEFGQRTEWSLERGLEWQALDSPMHAGMAEWTTSVNHLYRNIPALYEKQFDHEGFEWIDMGDAQGSTLSYLRRGKEPGEVAVVVLTFTPVVRSPYRVGLPHGGTWAVAANSDSERFGGSGVDALDGPTVLAEDDAWHGRDQSLEITLPPLAAVVLVPHRG